MGGRRVLWRSLKDIGNITKPTTAMAPVFEGVFGTVGFQSPLLPQPVTNVVSQLSTNHKPLPPPN